MLIYIARSIANGQSIRGIRRTFGVSLYAIYKILKNLKYAHRPKQKQYYTLEVDEFWTFVGSKKQKVWLIYAYHRETGEIVAYAWGKRNTDTARKLRNRLKSLGIRLWRNCNR